MPKSITMRVLMIEDDPQIAAFVQKGLQEAGCSVDVAEDGESGACQALSRRHDVIVLDLILPKRDGLAVLQELRAEEVTTPVLILSARRGVDDRVLGLRQGGDDYLVKPFAFEELLARLENLVRRSRGLRSPLQLEVDGLLLDLMERRVFRANREVEVKPREFALLEYLAKNAGRVVTRAQILQHVWGYTFHPSTNIVEVHVCRLREKIEHPDLPKLLHTIRGIGYRLGEAS